MAAIEQNIALGRRKTAVARVYLRPGNGKITINHRDMATYFPSEWHHRVVNTPFALTETGGKFDVVVNVKGGGQNGQAEAIRLGISRALVKNDEERRIALRAGGLLTRDPRMVERKKYGQPKARKRFQFSKR